MTFSWLAIPRISPVLITLFLTLQISACNTANFASAVADDFVSGTTRISNNSTPAPTIASPSTANTSTATDASAVAMYSYNANLSDAKPLSGSVLEQTMVYMFFDNASQYSSMDFYCCKGISGASTGEAHKTAVSDASAPFVYSVDISQYSTTGTRELYVDAARIDGSGYDSLTINFSINVTNTSAAPAPTYYSDVNLSWVAPVEREDNTAMSLSDIASYKIYYGTTKGSYTNSVSVNDSTAESHTFNNFAQGTYYFVITTRDVDGRESKYSSEITIVI